ncbi:phage tail tape measure protein [Enterobacter ludwigii]|uniref:hypothetical protein n=1 Tax=Enterobacter ludwigii TaxID=299767 RepID=UPI001866BA78|nr:hypothetical protein [Enterobacter ludwigii]
MSDRKLQLQVMLSAVDKITAPLKNIQAANKRLAAATKEARQEVKALESQVSKVDALNKLQTSVRQTSEKLRESSTALQRMSQAYRNTENPTQAFTAALNKQTREHQKLLAEQRSEVNKLTQLRGELRRNDIDTKDLAYSQALLSKKTMLANTAMAKQGAQLKRNSEMMRQYQKAKEIRNNLAIKGSIMMAGGGATMTSFAPAIHQATEYQQQLTQLKAMGAGDEFLQQSQKYAEGMNVMGSSTTENLKIIKEAYSILRNGHEALNVTPALAQVQVAQKILMSNGTIKHEDQDEQNSDSQALVKTAELLNHISSVKDFTSFTNLAMKANAASGGMVTARDYRNVVSTAGVAVSNIDPKAFFFTLSHLIQEKGGERTGTGLASAYQNMVMGRETKAAAEEQQKIGLLRPDAIQYTKTGQLAKVKADGIVNSTLFRTNPYQYLMTEIVPRIRKANPKLNEAGMEMAIAKLFSSRTAQDIMVTMYKQRSNIDKQVKAGNDAQTTQQIISGNKDSAVGQQLRLAAEKTNLKKQIGADIMPLYVKSLAAMADILHKINTEMTQHPKAAKYLIEGIAGVAALTVALGGLAVTMASIIGPFAALRYVFGMLRGGRTASREIKILREALEALGGSGEKAAKKPGLLVRAIKGLIKWSKKLPGVIRAVKSVVSVLARSAWLKAASTIVRAARMMSTAFRIVRLAMVMFGESMWALMANPVIAAIAIAIAAIGLAAYEMWKHWDEVKPALLKFWKDVCDAVSGAWDYLKNKWQDMAAWFEGLPARFKAFGSNIINGLMSGIDEKWKVFKSKLSSMTDMLPSWMRPDGSDAPDAPPDNPAGKPPGPRSWGTVTPRSAVAPGYGTVPPPVNIHVYPSQGMDEKALGDHTQKALEKHQRKQQSAQRSRLADVD